MDLSLDASNVLLVENISVEDVSGEDASVDDVGVPNTLKSIDFRIIDHESVRSFLLIIHYTYSGRNKIAIYFSGFFKVIILFWPLEMNLSQDRNPRASTPRPTL